MRKYVLPLFSILFLVGTNASAQTHVEDLMDHSILDQSQEDLRLDSPINRAEFATMLLRTEMKEESPAGDCFPDVSANQWFAASVCTLSSYGIINGYDDGLFHPERTITFAQAAKILTQWYSLPQFSQDGDPWFAPFMRTLAAYQAVPEDIDYASQPLTREMASELVWRLHFGHRDQPSKAYEQISHVPCRAFIDPNLDDRVDWERVRETWITWYNKARAEVGAPALYHEPFLTITSTSWSNTSASKGYIEHTKPGTVGYYDFFGIMDWFKREFGLRFARVGSSYYGESIAWNTFRCSGDDCTDALIERIRTSFDFFYNEKGKAYRPHYDMMINPNYQQLGLGVVIDEVHGKYWLTTHLATEVITDNVPWCK